MSTDTSLVTRSHEENWQPVLDLAVEEVFEIMLGCRVKPVAQSEHTASHDFTAMVGLAGALCGILTVCCSKATAHQLAKAMLGAAAESEEQVADALGEICNMVAGNFESGSAKMKTASQPAFDRIASMLRVGNYRLRIEGHTDNAPIHNSQFPSNWELSTSRATEIVRLLIVRDGFVPNRLSAAGFAEYHPVSSNRTTEGRGANRRVDIIILSKPAPPANAGVGDRTPGAHAPTPAAAAPGNLLKPSPAAAKAIAVHPALQPAVVRANEGRLPH
jgi:outer membrane protein OmpA-like peptidoglycan-associated protein